MDRKAFTLIEILAVILLLGIVLALLIPNMASIIRKNTDKVFSIKEKQISTYASDYVLLNNIKINEEGEIIPFITLIDEYLMEKIYEGDDECDGYVKVTKREESDGYDYTACIFCSKYKTKNNNCVMNNLP